MEMQTNQFFEEPILPFFTFTDEEKFNFWDEDYKLLFNKEIEEKSEIESPQEFLDYLDKNVKQEINLTESAQLSTSFNYKPPEVNLIYRGQKHNFDRGVNSERKDVLWKNLLRALRRYLWGLFKSEFDTSEFTRVDRKRIYNKSVWKFVDLHLWKCPSVEMLSSPSDEVPSCPEELRFLHICHIVSSIMTEELIFKQKFDKGNRLRAISRKWFVTFTKKDYHAFFRYPNMDKFFEVLLNSGMAKDLVQAYPKFKELEGNYFSLIESLVDYNRNPFLS